MRKDEDIGIDVELIEEDDIRLDDVMRNIMFPNLADT